jgi:TatD DNase family protein
MTPEWIDSHCHLNYDYSPKSIDQVITEATSAGVKTLLTVATDLAMLDSMVALSEKYPQVFHSVGVHPHEAITLQPGDLEKLRKAAAHPKCKAIGELGLDYHYDHSPREVQITQLESQLQLALELKLPVIIHSREAEEDLLKSLTHYAKQVSGGRSPGVIHCFSGTPHFGQACLDLGFYISFSGILTFKTANEIRETAKLFPMDRLLVETDSPYLAPAPHRGKKCEPSMVLLTGAKLAEIKGLSVAEVAQITSANSRKLFNLPA